MGVKGKKDINNVYAKWRKKKREKKLRGTKLDTDYSSGDLQEEVVHIYNLKSK